MKFFLKTTIILTILLFSQFVISITLDDVENLKQDGVLSSKTKQPIFLYVSAIGCPYCKRLERDIIAPMINSGDYDNKILMRKILWEDSSPIIDFDGEEVSPGDFLLEYDIMATPSILFLDANGQEIARRLDGYRSADLFWYYLDSSVDRAVEALKKRKD